MTQFKYTTEDNQIIHITSSPDNIVIEEPGTWSEMTNEEYEEFMITVQENMEKTPLPEPEPLTAEQKLQNAGLTVEELKSLLGL